MSDAAFWEPHLRPGERLIWTGRPRGGWRVGDFFQDMLLYFAPLYVLLAWMGAGSPPSVGATQPVFNLIWATPLLVFAAYFFLERRQRRQLRYAITDQRAMMLNTSEADRPIWVARETDVQGYAQAHYIWIGKKGAVPVLFIPGSFRHRALMSTSMETPRHGERRSLTFRDLPDGFAVLRVLRDSAPDRSQTPRP